MLFAEPQPMSQQPFFFFNQFLQGVDSSLFASLSISSLSLLATLSGITVNLNLSKVYQVKNIPVIALRCSATYNRSSQKLKVVLLSNLQGNF